MIYASPVGLLRTLAIILLFYYGFKFLSKYVLPVILGRFVQKMQQQGQQGSYNTQHQNVKEGTTTIDKKPQQSAQSTSAGEYIDFEEVED